MLLARVASKGDANSKVEEAATPAGRAINIELPSRVLISVESGADPSLVHSVLDSLRKSSVSV